MTVKLSTAIEEFLIANEADGLAVGTNKWYRSLLRHLDKAIPGVTIDQIDPKQIRRHMVNIRARFKEDTASGHLRAMHRFFTWCANEYDIKSPMRNVRYPKQPKQFVPKAIQTTDIIKLYEAAADGVTREQARRDRAIIALLTDTGIRAGGVIGLKVSDINFTTRRVVVLEKGDKVRSVPFSPFTAKLLKDWIDIKYTGTEYLFYSLKSYRPLTSSGLYQMLRRLKKKSGLVGRANPHAFRHGFAREFLRAGGDLATLSKLMGHEDISTTAAFYAVFTEDELAEHHAEFSQIRHLTDALQTDDEDDADEDDDRDKNDKESA